MGKLASLAPGRLSRRLRGGLTGHHPLFDVEAIRAAFEEPPDAPVSRDDATEVGRALLSIAREPLARARHRIAELSPSARDALIRLYFRLLDRASEPRPAPH